MLIDEAIKKLDKFEFASEILTLNEVVSRSLADDILAVKNVPSFDNSAMDGYAFKFSDKNTPLSIAGTIFAGQTQEQILKTGECYKIMTGAKIPQNADTIVPFEDAIIENEKLIISPKIKQFNAYRYKAEEIAKGQILLKKGEVLTPAKIMLLAAQGIFCIKVFKAPKIGIFSSGDEIVEPWQSANEEQIYNANAIGISALLLNFGFKSNYKGIIKDDLNATISQISNDDSDVLICSGGASAGEADFMKTALNSLGFVEIFGFLNMRPGRPTKAFVKDKKIVFILPGNPMAAFVVAFLLIVPFLKGEPNLKIKATIKDDLKVKSGRSNLVLGTLKNDEFFLTDGNKYGSGMITPLVKSNALYLTNIDESEICSGSEIFVYKLT